MIVSEMASLESFFENSLEKSVSELFYGHHIHIFTCCTSVLLGRGSCTTVGLGLHITFSWKKKKIVKSQLEFRLFGHKLDFI